MIIMRLEIVLQFVALSLRNPIKLHFLNTAGTLYKINSNEMDRGEIRTDVKEL